jgi:4'-phosphopantetheinyl transferase
LEALELWFVDLDASGPALDTLELQCPRLSDSDLKKISRSVTPLAAIERRAAYIALRVLIERMWGSAWRGQSYTLTGSGKPALPDLPGSFSLAHVERYALIGLARSGSIGVDLEPDRKPIVADDRRVRIEQAAIALARGAALPEPRQMRFLQAWVRLEAVAKADGRGIGRLLTGLGIIGAAAGDAEGFATTYADDVAARFWVKDLVRNDENTHAGCVAAVALDQPLAGLSARTLPIIAPEIEALMTNAARPTSGPG